MNGLKPTRNLTVVKNGAFPLDGHKAVDQKVAELEQLYENSLDSTGTSSGLTNLTGAITVVDTKHPFKVYVFNLTTVFATGTYTFTFVDVVPNMENYVDVASIDVTPATATIAVAGTQQLTVAYSPANADGKSVTYVSSVPARATVSATGLVTGVASGAVTITITSANGKTDTVAITVS